MEPAHRLAVFAGSFARHAPFALVSIEELVACVDLGSRVASYLAAD